MAALRLANIHVLRLPASMTHILQPLDVAFFSALHSKISEYKKSWRTEDIQAVATQTDAIIQHCVADVGLTSSAELKAKGIPLRVETIGIPQTGMTRRELIARNAFFLSHCIASINMNHLREDATAASAFAAHHTWELRSKSADEVVSKMCASTFEIERLQQSPLGYQRQILDVVLSVVTPLLRSAGEAIQNLREESRKRLKQSRRKISRELLVGWFARAIEHYSGFAATIAGGSALRLSYSCALTCKIVPPRSRPQGRGPT